MLLLQHLGRCAENNGDCSQFCWMTSETSRVCDCALGFLIASDGTSCTSRKSHGTIQTIKFKVKKCLWHWSGSQSGVVVSAARNSSTSTVRHGPKSTVVAGMSARLASTNQVSSWESEPMPASYVVTAGLQSSRRRPAVRRDCELVQCYERRGRNSRADHVHAVHARYPTVPSKYSGRRQWTVRHL